MLPRREKFLPVPQTKHRSPHHAACSTHSLYWMSCSKTLLKDKRRNIKSDAHKWCMVIGITNTYFVKHTCSSSCGNYYILHCFYSFYIWFLEHIAGTLSARMQIKGNMWVDVWEAAKPVPARRQKRLFDDTREAEKVLHFLESKKPSAFAELLLPLLTHAAICRLLQEQKEGLPMLPESFRHITKTAERITRNVSATRLRQYDVRTISSLGVFSLKFNFIHFISDL